MYQNCNIFNDGAFAAFYDKDVRQDKMVYLEHGKPLRFGKENQHGIRLNGFQPEVVENAAGDDGLLVHDTKQQNLSLANILVGMDYPEFPVPIGVFRDVDGPVYDQLVQEQVDAARAKGPGDLAAILHAGETWVVD